MNYKEIENLKLLLTKMASQGFRIKNDIFGVQGKVIGVGFKPFWTSPADNKIDKVELNILDGYGRVTPFYLYNVIGCDIKSEDGSRPSEEKNISLDIHIFAPNKARDAEPYNKIPIEFYMQ